MTTLMMLATAAKKVSTSFLLMFIVSSLLS